MISVSAMYNKKRTDSRNLDNMGRGFSQCYFEEVEGAVTVVSESAVASFSDGCAAQLNWTRVEG
jgi:hypothetical protein